MRGDVVLLCRDCHEAIHKFITEKELGKFYNTKEKLLSHERVASFVEWIATKKNQFSKVRR